MHEETGLNTVVSLTKADRRELGDYDCGYVTILLVMTVDLWRVRVLLAFLQLLVLNHLLLLDRLLEVAGSQSLDVIDDYVVCILRRVNLNDLLNLVLLGEIWLLLLNAVAQVIRSLFKKELLSRSSIFLVCRVVSLTLANRGAWTFLRGHLMVISKTSECPMVKIINYFLLLLLVNANTRVFRIVLAEVLLVIEVWSISWVLFFMFLFFSFYRSCFSDARIWLIFHSIVYLMAILVVRIRLCVNNGVLFCRSR